MSESGNIGRTVLRWIGEFVIIVVGVLIALAVDEWRKSIESDEIQKVLITALIVDLNSDKEDISQFIENCKSRAKSAELLLEGNMTNEERKKHTGNLGFTSRLEVVTSTFKEMSSSGTIQSIKDQELRIKISSYYGLAEDRLDVNEALQTEILRFRAALEDLGVPYRGGPEIPESVIQNPKVKALITVLGTDARIHGWYVGSLAEENQSLLDNLNSYLKNAE